MRMFLSLLSVAALMVAAAPITHAESDAGAISAAYADLTLFILNVANGHDGVAQNTDREQSIRAAFTEDFAQAYQTLSPDAQQALTQLPELDAQLQQGYANLPADQRAAVRDQLAGQIEDLQGSLTCPEYDALARANLTPGGQYQQENVNRLVACWKANPQLAKDNQGNQLTQAPAGGSGNHALFMSMMNMNMMSYAASMNVANNFGDGLYTYTVK